VGGQDYLCWGQNEVRDDPRDESGLQKLLYKKVKIEGEAPKLKGPA
jgi:hypothetical protein